MRSLKMEGDEMKSIRLKISLYVGLLVLVICLLLGVLAYNSGSSAVLAEVENMLIDEAEDAGQLLDNLIRRQIDILETIAARPDMVSMNWNLQREALETEANRLAEFLALGLIETDGTLRYPDGNTANISAEPHVQDVLAGKSGVSKMLVL